MQIGY
ncbi:UNVERIFIED_CONTAM: hypothetical protein GTU68_038121 [Idotea baltica]